MNWLDTVLTGSWISSPKWCVGQHKRLVSLLSNSSAENFGKKSFLWFLVKEWTHSQNQQQPSEYIDLEKAIKAACVLILPCMIIFLLIESN